MPAAAQYQDAESSALSLLSAAAFKIQYSDKTPPILSWPHAAHAARLFRSQPEDLPLTLDGFDAKISAEAQRDRRKAIAGLTWNRAQYRVQYQLSLDDGQSLWVEERGQRLQGEGETPYVISSVLHDIQTSKTDMDKAVYLAARDPLTGLWNRKRMGEEAAQLMGLASRNLLNPALVALTLTNLADINTQFGYSAGDRLLAGIADRLKTLVQAPDTVARFSGDTFILGVCDTDRDALKAKYDTLVAALSRQPYQNPNGELQARFDVAGAVRLSLESGGPSTAKEAFSYLELALAHSETTGQGLSYYHPDMAKAARPAAVDIIADDILSALNDRRVSLAYQPIIEAESRRIHHYECLLRLQRADGEIVSAADFIMAAEKLELVHLLDLRALELARESLLHRRDIALALNVSAATVKHDDNAADYLSALKGLGAMTNRVTIELTETVALDDPSKASAFSNACRALGCQFAIDDFGSGYTSFRNLMAIEADSIKIDGTFIQDLSLTPHKQTFIRMMVDLAQTFGVETVAEMVNTREDADLLKRLGVDYLQGYMFGVPSPMPTIHKQAS